MILSFRKNPPLVSLKRYLDESPDGQQEKPKDTKQMTSNYNDRGYHIKIGINGRPENIWLFQHALKYCDGDWPFHFVWNDKKQLASLAPDTEKVCSQCGGAFWKIPRLLSVRLRGFGRQFGVGVKVRTFAKAGNCKKGQAHGH